VEKIKRGLTLGKFAPLHKGHQLVIETALKEMDEVLVILYDCPKTTEIPLPMRAQWLRSLYPDVQVIEAWDGPEETGDTPEIKQKQETYVLQTLKLKGITHFYSSEFYGEHMSAALGAVNRLVDPERKVVPISATELRADFGKGREYLDPLVYRDLVIHAVFLGAPCTGKTTLARTLAREYKTIWMPEYGREYWEQNQIDKRLTMDQLEEIAEIHLQKEEELLRKANRYLFTDTNALTTHHFSLYYHGSATVKLRRRADQCAGRYDLVFVCDQDIPYEDTWDRSGEINRLVFHKQLICELILRKIPYFLLQGSLDNRIAKVKRILAHFKKFQNLGELFDKEELR